MTSAPDVFARSFAAWDIVLPDEAVAHRRDGTLRAAGWQIRYRWHADGSLEYRAGHRMTSEQWAIIGADGQVRQLPVPAEFKVCPADATDEDRRDVDERYGAEWRRHGELVVERGMSYDEGMDATGVGVDQ